MQSKAKTVEQYLSELPEGRREAIAAVRKVILDHLPKRYEEVMQGMIGYVVPLERHPVTYNKQPLAYAGLASQKNYMALYLSNVYADEATAAWFKAEYAKTGKRLDMGKSCVRFRKLEDLPLPVVAKTIARTPVSEFIESYDNARGRRRARGRPGV
jgi:Domain of unknown function (DU1801)